MAVCQVAHAKPKQHNFFVCTLLVYATVAGDSFGPTPPPKKTLISFTRAPLRWPCLNLKSDKNSGTAHFGSFPRCRGFGTCMTSALARALKLTAYHAVRVFKSQARACMHDETDKRVGIGDRQGGEGTEALLANNIVIIVR